MDVMQKFYPELEEDIASDDISLQSFELQDELNDRFWDSEKRLDQHIRKALLQIAKEFIDEYDLGTFDIEDVVITGSIANYNWNENFSDIDLHIIMDITQVNNNKDIAKAICDAMKNLWNKVHTDISVGGFPVELYIQDSHEPHKSTGVYSLLDDDWCTEPAIDKLPIEYDDEDVKGIAASFMNKIDALEDSAVVDNPEDTYEQAVKIMDDIKAERADSMKDSEAELSTGNVAFKTLRRNGYIEKLAAIKLAAYDAMYSLR